MSAADPHDMDITRRPLIALAAAVLVLTACSAESGTDELAQGFEDCEENPNTCNGAERQSGGTMIWALDQPPDAYFTWSPEGGSVYGLQAIHGILPHFGQYTPAGEFAYNLDVLQEEPQVVNEEPLQTVWKIRPEAVWEDGSPIGADDVIITWKMSTSKDEGHCVGCRPRGTAADVIENIEGSDGGKTVTITYKEGIADPEWFAFGSAHNIIGGIAPAHVAVQNGWDPENPEHLGEYFEFLHENPPQFSGGPYLIEEFDLETQVVKVPNPRWYGSEQPTLDRLVIRFLSEPSTWVPAVQNDELHGGSPAGWSEDTLQQLRDLDGVRTYIQPGPSWEHLDINMDNRFLGGDVELRRAIFTAVDAASIADRNFAALYPDYTLRNNHIHRSDSEFHVDHLAGTGQGTGDLAAARGILAAAGYEGYEDGGTLTRDGERIGPFRLRSTNAPARMTSLSLIQSYLAEIGIEANIEVTDDLGDTLQKQDYDLIQYGWSGSPLFTGLVRSYWHSESGNNFGKYRNPQVDALAEEEERAATLAESAEIHDQAMEIVINDCYVLPLYDNPVYLFVTDNYANVRDNTNTSLRALYDHHQWGLAVE
jgi:peptide/nickel transport system substrate-binding protein